MSESYSKMEEATNQVIDWLNEVSTSNGKVECLWKVKEVLLNKEPLLLDHFIDHVLEFQAHRNREIQDFISSFIESVGVSRPTLLPKLLPNLLMNMGDDSSSVRKKAIKVAGTLYKAIVKWLVRSALDTVKDVNEIAKVWEASTTIKSTVINMVDNDNDGIRNQTVYFLGAVIMYQTNRQDVTAKRANTDDVSIFDIPPALNFINCQKLENEAMTVFDLLVGFHTSTHINHTSLMTCICVLSELGLARPQLMCKVIPALESVHVHLPPSMQVNQAQSVKKFLKTRLLSIIKHPASIDYHHILTALLANVGVPQNEVSKIVTKILPKEDERRRKIPKKLAEPVVTANNNSSVQSTNGKSSQETMETIDLLKEPASSKEEELDELGWWIYKKLDIKTVYKLIAASMRNLPSKIPATFNNVYVPFETSNTPGEIKKTSKLLADLIRSLETTSQDNQASLEKSKVIERKLVEDRVKEVLKDHSIDIITTKENEKKQEVEKKPKVFLKPAVKPTRVLKMLEITKPLKGDLRECMAINAVNRILNVNKNTIQGSAIKARYKIICSMATTFGLGVREAILNHLLSNLKQRIDLALAWLYEEFSILQGFYKLPDVFQHNQKPDHNYNTLLCALAFNIMQKAEVKDKYMLLNRLFLEAPIITDNALEMLKEISTQDIKVLHLLQQLVLKRPPKQLLFLNVLLSHTSHQDQEIEECTLKLVVELYERKDLRSIIEEYATFYLKLLKLPSPPEILFGPDKGELEPSEMWTEATAKACMRLYLSLLPFNEELIHELAEVYAITVAEVKRVMIRQIEQPIQSLSMSSPELLKLVEEFPTGAETLVTKILQIITDRKQPAVELVVKVRELYETKVNDVRFLIPVIQGLSKTEIIEALPIMIRLHPNVVKEIFGRLLRPIGDGNNYPISPADLAVALHQIDTSKCEIQHVIKATSLCFGFRDAYTQDVLAVTIQKLMDVDPLPTLLMRTVIQSITFFPRLTGFCMNVLQRLILKKVWEYPKVWQGFIKCCEKTKPKSFQVLLQLPITPLNELFQLSPDLKSALAQHIMNLTEAQKKHVSEDVLGVLFGIDSKIIRSLPSVDNNKEKEETDDIDDLEIEANELINSNENTSYS